MQLVGFRAYTNPNTISSKMEACLGILMLKMTAARFSTGQPEFLSSMALPRGIEYLHGNKPNKSALVHQNISAEKVLINQHFSPLLSDSGLHNLLADDAFFSTLKDSAGKGYLAPEYTIVGRFTERNDVYAFGVIIFQILSGKRTITQSMRLGAESGKLEDLMDDKLQGKFLELDAQKLSKIALVCTNEDPDQRPTMKMVIEELSKGS